MKTSMMAQISRKIGGGYYPLTKKKKAHRKGFSLVELIVVLVIMAILVAALVPSLVGYIRQARQSTIKDEAASCVQAAQTIASTAYASSDMKYVSNSGTGYSVDFSSDGDCFKAGGTETAVTALTYADSIEYLAEVPSTAAVSNVKLTAGVVTYLEYTSNSMTVTYDADASPKYNVT